MTPDEHTAAIRSLQSDVAGTKGTLNNGLRAMVQDQRTELATVKEDIQQIRDPATGHVAKEDVIQRRIAISAPVMVTPVFITRLKIGHLLVDTVGLH